MKGLFKGTKPNYYFTKGSAPNLSFWAKYVKSHKSAWIGFLVLNVPYFVPSFGKTVGAVSENEPGRTDERTDGGDSIGPFGFQPGTNYIYHVIR